MSETETGLSAFDLDRKTAPAAETASRAATAPFQLSQDPVTPEGERETRSEAAPAFEHLGELPRSYGTQSLYLVAYDPHQLFAYWDIDWSVASGKAFALQVLRADQSVESRFELSPAETSRYLPVDTASARYSVELASRGRDGQWKTLATSGPVTMPPEGIAAESEPTFATLPFHLSFQRLVDLLKGAMRPKEELTDVLARLQHRGQLAASSLLGALGSLGEEQLRTLSFLAREGFDPQEDFSPTSGGGSPVGLSSPGRFGGGASENLSSGNLARGGLSSGNLSSGSLARSDILSSSLSSEIRLAAAAAGAESLTSSSLGSQGRWAAGGMSSETLSSRGGRQAGPLLSARGMGSESLSSGDWARRALSVGTSSETLSSARGGLSSGAYAAAAARGSEILGSAQKPGAFGVSSEAWRRAGGASVGSSENLSSSQSSAFVRAMETNLEVLGALFSAVDSRLSGELGSSSGSSLTSSSRGRW